MRIQQVVPTHLEGRQWKSILTSELGASRKLVRQLVQDDNMLVNGHPVYLTSRAVAGDILSIQLPNETSSVVPEPSDRFHVTYEDDEVLVVNKPPGVLSHPTAREQHGSVLGFAASYLKETGLVPHCVHRLDRDTSGVLMLAKHAHFHHLYDVALRRGLIHRTYVAIVEGLNPSVYGDDGWYTIDLPVAGDPMAPSKRIIHEEGQRAITHFKRIAQVGSLSLVGIRLETGRTHQIRIHFAEIGAPLVGDPHYGLRSEREGEQLLNRRPARTLSRQALHAIRLQWKHPLTLEHREARALPPEDITSFWVKRGGSANDFERAFTLVLGEEAKAIER